MPPELLLLHGLSANGGVWAELDGILEQSGTAAGRLLTCPATA